VKALALVHRMPGPPEVWVKEAGEQFAGPIFAPLAGDRLKLPLRDL
jgi:hypothetical protein